MVGDLYCSVLEVVDRTLPSHTGIHVLKSVVVKWPNRVSSMRVRSTMVTVSCRWDFKGAPVVQAGTVNCSAGGFHRCIPRLVSVLRRRGFKSVTGEGGVGATGRADVAERGADQSDTAVLGSQVDCSAAGKAASPCGGAQTVVSNAV